MQVICGTSTVNIDDFYLLWHLQTHTRHIFLFLSLSFFSPTNTQTVVAWDDSGWQSCLLQQVIAVKATTMVFQTSSHIKKHTLCIYILLNKPWYITRLRMLLNFWGRNQISQCRSGYQSLYSNVLVILIIFVLALWLESMTALFTRITRNHSNKRIKSK